MSNNVVRFGAAPSNPPDVFEAEKEYLNRRPGETASAFEIRVKERYDPDDPDGAEHILRHLKISLRKDAFLDTILITDHTERTPREEPLNQETLDVLQTLFETKANALNGGKYKAGEGRFLRVLKTIAVKNKVHPVMDYFRKAQNTWDGTPRIDTWLSDYCGVEDTPYHRAVGRLLLIAVVRRIRHPGHKYDYLVVFEGGGGLRKSTMATILAIREEWFTDRVLMNMSPKEIIEQTRGKVIAEFAELSVITKGETSTVKRFFRTEDSAREAHARLRTDLPRQFVPIATMNATDGENTYQYLSDGAGNRRFLPVRLGDRVIDTDGLTRDLLQLYGEAAYWESRGELLVLPEKHKAEQIRLCAERMVPPKK